MKSKRPQLPEWVSGFGIFLLRSFGWIAIAILVVYLASYFVKLPSNRTDIFSLVEVLFGIVITALAIVASFAVSFQWNALEASIRDFQKESEDTAKRFESKATEINTAYNNMVDHFDELAKNVSVQAKSVGEVNDILMAQRQKIDAQDQLLRGLDRDLNQMQALADTIIDLALSVADINPPWLLDNWAKEVTNRYKTAEIPKNMTLSYLKVVDEFITQPTSNVLFFHRSLHDRRAPSTELGYYWNKVLEWERATEEHYYGVIGEVAEDTGGKGLGINVPEPLRIVREKVHEYRPKVEPLIKSEFRNYRQNSQ